MSFPLINPSHQFFDTSGAPLVSGTIEFQNPTTAAKINTYPTADDADAQTNANSNPLTLDSRGGYTGIYLEDGVKYKFILKDSAGATVDTQDDVLSPIALPYQLTAAESAAGVTPANLEYPPGNVLRYGTNSAPGTTDMTTAFDNAILSSSDIYIPAGTYAVGAIALGSTFAFKTIRGDGPGVSILQQIAATGNVLAFVTAQSTHTVSLRNFSIQGHASSSAGHGIHFPTLMTIPPFSCSIENVVIRDMGGAGIKDEMGNFTFNLYNVWIDDCLDHQFDLEGGNTTTLINCYALDVPTAGKAGFRIHSGSPTMIGCNGINSGEYWGIFSDSVADEGTQQFCFPTMIGCNIEDFTVVGVLNKSSGINLAGTNIFTAPTSGTVKAILMAPNNNPGILLRNNSFDNTKGASWANSQPVHTSTNGVAWLAVYASDAAGATEFTWYNENTAAEQTMSLYKQTAISANNMADAPRDLFPQRWFRSNYCGTATLSSGTIAVDFTDDGLEDMPFTSYEVFTSSPVDETMFITAKGTTGFTINSSNGSSSSAIGWMAVIRK